MGDHARGPAAGVVQLNTAASWPSWTLRQHLDPSKPCCGDTQEEIDRLRREIAERWVANEQALPEADYAEVATHDLFIDVMLREAGWDPHGADVCEYPVTGMPNATGEGFVDNVLWGRDKLPLALVEAKVSPPATASSTRT